jgi:hypothetical protein
MDQPRQASRRETIAIGAIAAAIGLYFVLVSLDLLPAPGGAKAPMWVVTLCGLCFLLGGLATFIPAAVTGEVRSDGELPAGAPRWLRVLQYLFGLMIFACFAMIGSFVAFGPGARSFGVSLPFMTFGEGNALFGRIAFGIGAVIIWLCTIGFAVQGWRKLVRGGKA